MTATMIRPLNAADRFLMAVDRSMRRLGGPGFETQTFVWLADRLDATQLASDVAQLSQRFPVLTARLVEAGGPYWQIRADAAAALQETNLGRAEPQAALDFAAGLLSAPTDPAEVDPVRFHLIHRPDGRDVFLLQYNHALIDHADALLLLKQLNTTGQSDSPPHVGEGQPVTPAFSHPEGTRHPASNRRVAVATIEHPWRDSIWRHLSRFPKSRRRTAAIAAENWRQCLRGGAIHLGPNHTPSGSVSFRIVTRRLEPPATAALAKHVVRTCGVPSLSMAVLAAALRAIQELASDSSGVYFNTGIGVDLGIRRGGLPALQNLTTLVPLRATRDEVAEFDTLIQFLVRQFRGQLDRGMDLGVLELATVYGRKQHQARWTIEILLRFCISLWYASFGTLREIGTHFRAAPVEEAYSAGPAWPPVGLTLLVNQHAGRLHLQATYIPECVSDMLANEFLNRVMCDFKR
jgi:hypothetical protein